MRVTVSGTKVRRSECGSVDAHGSLQVNGTKAVMAAAADAQISNPKQTVSASRTLWNLLPEVGGMFSHVSVCVSTDHDRLQGSESSQGKCRLSKVHIEVYTCGQGMSNRDQQESDHHLHQEPQKCILQKNGIMGSLHRRILCFTSLLAPQIWESAGTTNFELIQRGTPAFGTVLRLRLKFGLQSITHSAGQVVGGHL
jgi:hypothetical protein